MVCEGDSILLGGRGKKLTESYCFSPVFKRGRGVCQPVECCSCSSVLESGISSSTFGAKHSGGTPIKKSKCSAN